MELYFFSGVGFESMVFDTSLKLPAAALGGPEALCLAAMNVVTGRMQTRKAPLRGFKLAEDKKKFKLKRFYPLRNQRWEQVCKIQARCGDCPIPKRKDNNSSKASGN